MGQETEWSEGQCVETEARAERCYWRRVGFVIFLAVALALIFGPGRALAQTFSAEDESGKLTLTKEPCSKAGAWFAKWRMARWVYRGKEYDACWSTGRTSNGADIVLIIDSEGQVSNFDTRRFRLDEGV